MARTAILNVSLDEKIQANATIERRFEIVRAALRLCGEVLAGEIQPVEYDGPDGRVREHCGVFTVKVDGARPVFEQVMHNLAATLGQECIAVMYEDQAGVCCGPGAERWAFNLEYFRRPIGARAEAA